MTAPLVTTRKKTNVMVDALSQKLVSASVSAVVLQHQIVMDLDRVGGRRSLGVHRQFSCLANLARENQDSLEGRWELVEVMEGVWNGLKPNFNVSVDGILRFHTWICVPNDVDIKWLILEEDHRSLYTIHPTSTKMYRDLQELFWWSNMKREIAIFVEQWLTCDYALKLRN
ncbi:uncharacterized protein LOC131163535 [Malania oleifera]|uniref:uncharacterized protein LOC131163535 n=1 Tax=Malania oleifera TaxID=397392 RepID=UPI0025ADEE59|nr:uncharacterized protein LOC131163535 [Malania oleifera]